jgi:hypothetical protein
MTSNWHSRATWGMTLGLIISLALLLLVRPGPFGTVAASLEYDTLDFWFSLREPRRLKTVALSLSTKPRCVVGTGAPSRRATSRVCWARSNGGRASVALDFPSLGDPILRMDGQPELAAAVRAHGGVVLPLEWWFSGTSNGAMPRRKCV